jgi:hypothetical protein
MAAPAHPRKLCLFAALSLADLALTRFLIEHRGGGAYEQNPVAAWFLDHFDWTGLAAFKLGSVLLVVSLVLTVARRRPGVAGRVLTFGCAALLAVLLYSGSLVARVNAASARLEQVEEEGFALERERDKELAFAALRVRLQDDLVARRCTLAEAVDILAACDWVQSGGWFRSAGRFCPGSTMPERLAGNLVKHILLSSEFYPDPKGELAAELDRQFRSLFGRPARDLAAAASLDRPTRPLQLNGT